MEEHIYLSGILSMPARLAKAKTYAQEFQGRPNDAGQHGN
jgi:hypothetical protein